MQEIEDKAVTGATSEPRLDGPLLCAEEAAQLLSAHRSWVYEAVRSGVLPYLRVGRHIRFTRRMQESWLREAHTQP